MTHLLLVNGAVGTGTDVVEVVYISLYISDWLSRQNHKQNKDEEITGMQVSITTMQPECMMLHELQ